MARRALPLLAALVLSAQAEQPHGDGFTRVRAEGGRVLYAGSATLSGRVERRTDDESLELIGDQICLFPTRDSAPLIPREAGDARTPWFCFTNRATAMKLLQLPRARPRAACGHVLEATVVVTDYVADRRESDVFDTARLVRVVARRPGHELPCRP